MSNTKYTVKGFGEDFSELDSLYLDWVQIANIYVRKGVNNNVKWTSKFSNLVS